MQKIQNQKHSVDTFYYSLTRMLEGVSYYGLSALVVLYMTGEILKMDSKEALTIYGWFVGSVMFSQMFGALLGDLLIGNKKSIIIGGIIQALGALALCIPNTYGLYAGLFFVVLGHGFFTPNIIANYGKSYLNKTELLDSGFTIFYLVINLGSFLGIMAMGYLGEKFGYSIGFLLCGLLTLLSLIPILKTKENEFQAKERISIGKRVLIIIIAFIITGLYWGGDELANNRIFDLQLKLEEVLTVDIFKSVWQLLSFLFILPISIITIILWTYFYSNQFFKLMLGFIIGAISFGILFLIPEVPTEQHIITYLIAGLLLAISEIHIVPIIYSILTKYSNPKYLAILISLVFLPTRLISLAFGLFNDNFFANGMLGLKIGIVGMTIIGIGLIAYIIIDKRAAYK